MTGCPKKFPELTHSLIIIYNEEIRDVCMTACKFMHNNLNVIAILTDTKCCTTGKNVQDDV